MNAGFARVRSIALLAVVAAMPACSLMSDSLVDRIPPDAMTRTAMGETFVRIQMYMKEHRELPPSLAVLPTRKGYANSTTDGWGRPLGYTADEKGVITLTSLGADGKPGGDGLDQDIIQRYRTRNPDGSLNVDDDNWIIRAEVK
jgi:hypothetical protein